VKGPFHLSSRTRLSRSGLFANNELGPPMAAMLSAQVESKIIRIIAAARPRERDVAATFASSAFWADTSSKGESSCRTVYFRNFNPRGSCIPLGGWSICAWVEPVRGRLSNGLLRTSRPSLSSPTTWPQGLSAGGNRYELIEMPQAFAVTTRGLVGYVHRQCYVGFPLDKVRSQILNTVR